MNSNKFKQIIFLSPSITSWLNLSVKSLGMLALIPLVNVSFSELDRFLWFSLASSWSLVMLLDVGLSATTTRYFSYLNATENLSEIIPSNLPFNHEDIKALTRLVSKFYYGAMIFVVILVFPGVFYSVYDKLIESPKFFEYVCLMIGVSVMSLTYLFSNAFNGVTQGLGFLPRVQLTQFVAGAVSIALAVIAIYTTKDLTITVLCFYAPFAVYFFVIRRTAFQVISARFSRMENSNFKGVRHSIFERLLRDTLKSGVGIFASQGLIIGSVMLVNKLESIEVALIYMICMQIVRAICSFSQVPFYSRIPFFCSLYAKKEYRSLGVSLTQKFIFSMVLYLALVVFVGLISRTELGYLIFGSELNLTIWICFCCTFLVERIGAILIQVFTVTGVVKWHVVNAGGGLLSLAIILFAPLSLGVYTILGAIFLSYLFFVIPYIAFYIVKEPNLHFPKFSIS